MGRSRCASDGRSCSKERKAALDEGRTKNGIAVIDVYVDACWSMRSYGNNYKASSGAAAIIGRRYGEQMCSTRYKNLEQAKEEYLIALKELTKDKKRIQQETILQRDSSEWLS
ncbi:hypothetical protein EVAR_95552_1 [Eumeta japonica]|uniref:Mutator-like transposase domain-containing protein n=1 Tax=Eumeta variegata TaxID=151549 RepID=A0A4C2AHR9_EUMVA|nr:hypothetical protein EVAR_95552_1 [Eumeta japonica]